MGPMNAKVVRRTNAIMGYPYAYLGIGLILAGTVVLNGLSSAASG